MLDVVLNTLLHEGEGRGMRATMLDLNTLIKNGEDIDSESSLYNLHYGVFIKSLGQTHQNFDAGRK